MYILYVIRPTCVYVCVFLHVRLLVESLAAVLTRIGSRVAVNEKVCGQRGRALEALAALLARESLLVSVHRAVLAQTHRVSERLLADVTLVRSSAAVRPAHVHLQSVTRGERALTIGAVEGLQQKRPPSTIFARR